MKTKTHLLFVPDSTSVVQRILTYINVDLGWVWFRLSKTGMVGRNKRVTLRLTGGWLISNCVPVCVRYNYM